VPKDERSGIHVEAGSAASEIVVMPVGKIHCYEVLEAELESLSAAYGDASVYGAFFSMTATSVVACLLTDPATATSSSILYIAALGTLFCGIFWYRSYKKSKSELVRIRGRKTG